MMRFEISYLNALNEPRSHRDYRPKVSLLVFFTKEMISDRWTFFIESQIKTNWKLVQSSMSCRCALKF